MRLLTATIAILLMAGCASQPTDTAAGAPAATPATAQAPASGTATKTSAVSPYPGYKAKTRSNGTTVYCKKVARIGSNFQDETCLTAAEMEDIRSKADQDREAFRRNQQICGGGNCGGG